MTPPRSVNAVGGLFTGMIPEPSRSQSRSNALLVQTITSTPGSIFTQQLFLKTATRVPMSSSSCSRLAFDPYFPATSEVFVKDGVEIRRLESGQCILENEWTQFVYVNKVCPLRYHRHCVRLTLGQVLDLCYMLKNEPFEKLPIPYRPVQERGHHPPRLSLGFPVRKELVEFRRVALKLGLKSDMDIKTTVHFRKLTRLVLGHLNELCGLPPDKGMTIGWVHSREAAVVIELETNYNWWIPEEKLEDAVGVIKEHFGFPSDAKPKWYLEDDIDEKEPDEYLLPSKSPGSYDGAVEFLIIFLSVCF